MKKEHPFLRFLFRTALTAGALYAVNDMIDSHATEKHLLTSTDSNYFEWRGMHIYFNHYGEGEPVIFLHDLHATASSAEFHRIEEAVADGHTVYLVDLPGMGRSEKKDEPYTCFYYVEFLKSFIREMQLKDVCLIASNTACPVAVMASVYLKDEISRIVLICPPDLAAVKGHFNPFARIEKKVLSLPIVGNAIYNILNCRERIDLAFTEQYLYNPFNENQRMVDVYYEASHLGNGMARYFEACKISGYLNGDISHPLSKMEVPCLIIEGDEIEHTEAIVDDWKAHNSGIESVMIEHTKLLPHFEKPEEVAESIREFID